MSKVTPENQAKKRTKDLLAKFCREKNVKAKLVWNAGAAYGVDSVDCTGVIMGYPIAIEVKRLDGQGHLTTRQKMFLDEWRDAGGYRFVIESEVHLVMLWQWLEKAHNMRVLVQTASEELAP